MICKSSGPLGKEVVLKKQTTKDMIGFLKELDLLVRLAHDNVVAVVDVCMQPTPTLCFNLRVTTCNKSWLHRGVHWSAAFLF